jgi:putative OPT family oligopeptide transporter
MDELNEQDALGDGSRTGGSPFIPSTVLLPEFTLRAVLLGTVLGVIFGASSLYLVLKVGLTVSASIPVAVISLTLFRLVARLGGRDATVLENNIAQTAGSAGESIAFGVGATMPAILILGFDLELLRVMLVAVLGGLLGILMMIPMRRALVADRRLPFPEGTACNAVLQAAASRESLRAAGQAAALKATHSAPIFVGFAVGLFYKLANVGAKAWKDVAVKTFGAPLPGASVGIEVSPELLGVGYIIGPRVASVMCSGGVLAYLVLIPLIRFFGAGRAEPLAPGTMPIGNMSPGEIRAAYVLYIGAGAVAVGGLISVARSLPVMARGLRGGLRAARAGVGAVARARTERDLPLLVVLAGIGALVIAIALAPPLHMNALGALLIVAFGYLFVTVSARLTGEIGSSSNPVSGMTVATLLITSLIFLAVGWRGGSHYVTALSVGAIVCIAAANAGTTAQDLKTGHLLGSTPKAQQLAILAGALASALALGPILLKLNESATVYVPVAQVAPGLATDATRLDQRERLQGPQAVADGHSYRVWHKADDLAGPAGKYLVDGMGRAVWLVDPGINGSHALRPDGTEVRKYDAPKATLMAYIIKGILDQKLPWGLVLFGAGIAVCLEMAGVSSLPFAVGVYLPLSTSAPIFVGGMLRALAQRRRNNGREHSPGILLASGLIAGGAMAGIFVALSAGVFSGLDALFGDWAKSNPFATGSHADALSLLPFAGLVALLYGVGRDHGAAREARENLN